MQAEIVRKNIATLVDAYREATGLSVATISNKFYGNSVFVPNFLRKKGDPKRLTTSIDQLETFVRKMKKAWPKDASVPMLRTIRMDW
jgi:hypothetical protein